MCRHSWKRKNSINSKYIQAFRKRKKLDPWWESVGWAWMVLRLHIVPLLFFLFLFSSDGHRLLESKRVKPLVDLICMIFFLLFDNYEVASFQSIFHWQFVSKHDLYKIYITWLLDCPSIIAARYNLEGLECFVYTFYGSAMHWGFF